MPKGSRDTYTPEGKKFFAEIQKLVELEVQAGFTIDKSGYGESDNSVNAEDYPEGPTVAEVAAWNEFGTVHIPPRPFMRQSVDKYESQIKTMCAEQLKAIAEGSANADEALRAIGALQVGLIQHEIGAGGFVENADSTIKQKDSSQPLIDEGRMRQSVLYVVKKKG